MVEFTVYKDIPHLGWNVVNDVYETPKVFRSMIAMMEDRYRLACKLGARNLQELNEKSNQAFPYFICIVDEMADLIMTMKKEIEEYIVRIAQKARAVGIHLIFATQSPRREVCTGILKCNLPSRIAFSTSSALDSRIILDKSGAENLLGNGDMLFSSQGRMPERFQAPLIDSQEIKTIIGLAAQ